MRRRAASGSTEVVRYTGPAPAPHGGAPVKLKAAERRLLDEALRLGTDLADEMKARVSAYGRWLLEEVFANDAGAALDERTDNPVWLELARRAGGPTLALSRRMLYVAVHLAAYDKRIADPAWRTLDAGRKEILLPLRDEARLRAAAKRVTKFNLSQTHTRTYVTQLLAEGGGHRQVRFSAKQLAGRMRKLREHVANAGTLKRVRELGEEMDAAERKGVVAELDALRASLAEIRKAVLGR